MTAALTFFPDTTGCPRAYRLLRAVCEPTEQITAPIPGAEDIHPLGEVLEYVIVAKMTCLFADWLTRTGGASDLPRPMQQFLRAQLRFNTYRSQVHHQEAVRVITALQGHDIPAAAINGIAHASLLYPDAGVRQSSDVDILIPAEAAAAAADLLTQRGYYTTGRRATALHRDFDDQLVPGLTLDLTTHLAHTDDNTTIQDILARRTFAPERSTDCDPLPILDRADGFLHTLARVGKQRRWPALADALRYATDGTGCPTPAERIPAAAQAGWDIVRECWPHLTPDTPLTGTRR